MSGRQFRKVAEMVSHSSPNLAPLQACEHQHALDVMLRDVSGRGTCLKVWFMGNVVLILRNTSSDDIIDVTWRL